MDWEGIVARLEREERILNVVEIAEIFGVHLRTVDRWLKEYEDFPAPAYRGDVGTKYRGRYWRPDELLTWAKERGRVEQEYCDLDEAAQRVGLPSTTFTAWIKRGKAPAASLRELGSGRMLWSLAVLDGWLKETTGGYRFPNAGKTHNAVNPVRTEHGKRGPKAKHAAIAP